MQLSDILAHSFPVLQRLVLVLLSDEPVPVVMLRLHFSKMNLDLKRQITHLSVYSFDGLQALLPRQEENGEEAAAAVNYQPLIDFVRANFPNLLSFNGVPL